jgi:RHS repeat-associated protein
MTASTGSLVNPFQYTARESDSETGLYYYRARYYDPTTGRFLREDPTKNIVVGMNFYVYVRNDPIRFADPTGRNSWDWARKLLERLKSAHETKEKIESPIDWALCGVYYVSCLETALGIKEELAQALNSKDPVVAATAKAELAQQVGANSESMMNIKTCMANNDNCKKALECANKGFTNPLPFPSNNWFTDLVETVKHFFSGDEE